MSRERDVQYRKRRGPGLPPLIRRLRGGTWAFGVAAFAATDTRAEPFSHVEEDARGREGVASGDKDPLRGSTLLFEQSMSLQTARLDPSASLSYVPYYGWWLSFRPRWNFGENLRVQGRFDYYKEFTNSQDTTYYREDVFGDIWTEFIYENRVAHEGPWKNTKLTFGLRALWPTSKQSQGSGIYVTLGGFASVSQKIPLQGEGAKALNSARLGLGFVYLHPFSKATTPTEYGNFQMISQSDSGVSSDSDQLTGLTLARHEVDAVAEANLQITPKLDIGVSAIWIDQWHYSPPPAAVSTWTGTVTVPRVDDEQFTQFFWIVAALDYDLFDEVSLGAGYYDLTNVIGLNGTRRSPFLGGEDNAFWSPNAAFFFDVTANLDKIWERASGRGRQHEHDGDTASAARNAREARLLGEWSR